LVRVLENSRVSDRPASDGRRVGILTMIRIVREMVALEELECLRCEAAEVQIVRADSSSAWLVVNGLCSLCKAADATVELAGAFTVRESGQGEQCRAHWSVDAHRSGDCGGRRAFRLSCHSVSVRLVVDTGRLFSHGHCVVSATV
jgi:hypothetical protein